MTVLPEIRQPFDPVAFVLALIGAPLMVTALTFWLLLIPVAAAIVGTPIYLALGTPVLLWMVGRFEPRFATFALAGFLGNLALLIFCVLAEQEGWAGVPRGYSLIPSFGLIFAPAWAGTFAVLYRNLYRPARLTVFP